MEVTLILIFFESYVQPNLYKTSTLGNTQKWLSWAGLHLIKHLHKTATKQMCLSLAGF